MINPQGLELPMSRTNSMVPKMFEPLRFDCICGKCSAVKKAICPQNVNSENPSQPSCSRSLSGFSFEDHNQNTLMDSLILKLAAIPTHDSEGHYEIFRKISALMLAR